MCPDRAISHLRCLKSRFLHRPLVVSHFRCFVVLYLRSFASHFRSFACPLSLFRSLVVSYFRCIALSLFRTFVVWYFCCFELSLFRTLMWWVTLPSVTPGFTVSSSSRLFTSKSGRLSKDCQESLSWQPPIKQITKKQFYNTRRHTWYTKIYLLFHKIRMIDAEWWGRGQCWTNGDGLIYDYTNQNKIRGQQRRGLHI